MTLADVEITAVRLLERLAGLVTSPTSNFSAISLLSAFVVAATFLLVKRGRARPVRVAAIVRALLPKRWLRSDSVRADVGLLLFNTFVAGALFGWTLVSASLVQATLARALDPAFGSAAWFVVSPVVHTAILSVTIYLAYEFGYYVDHYLKHRVPVLWHFHRVHHSATDLNPLTNARIHPVDGAIFANITALCTGTMGALVEHVFAAPNGSIPLWNVNAIMFVALFLLLHLQHSHVWIPFTGRLGKLILSPAHHQLHHSDNPKHFNRNLGATLAIFDRIGGTLLVPTKQREHLTYGAGSFDYDPHSATGTLLMPFVDAAKEVRANVARSAEPEPATR